MMQIILWWLPVVLMVGGMVLVLFWMWMDCPKRSPEDLIECAKRIIAIFHDRHRYCWNSHYRRAAHLEFLLTESHHAAGFIYGHRVLFRNLSWSLGYFGLLHAPELQFWISAQPSGVRVARDRRERGSRLR